jgi:folate-dependent phosphoribosylglycinamide formyltransferase PurN
VGSVWAACVLVRCELLNSRAPLTSPEPVADGVHRGVPRRVVLLAGPGDTTDIVANWLDEHISPVTLITEEPQSRAQLTRRRIKRIGWVTTFGQVIFIAIAMPLLRLRGQRRREQILSQFSLNDAARPADFRVDSVNSREALEILALQEPLVVVVNGTRIISSRVLDSISCPVINTHAGITPRYRGVHGGYWALAEGHPEDVGTTVHLVDQGIDTGRILARARFETSPADTIVTYPYLHLAAGLPLLIDPVRTALDGRQLTPLDDGSLSVESRLFTHPTIWGYLRLWVTKGVR